MKFTTPIKTLLSTIGLIFFLVIAFGSGDAKDNSVDLNAEIRFTGTKFKITNNDNFSWKDVKFEINDDYILKTSIIKPNSSYEVGTMQFTKSDGTRFNPFRIKPKEFTISCNTSIGKRGWYFGKWN